jgi:hypothetical protein
MDFSFETKIKEQEDVKSFFLKNLNTFRINLSRNHEQTSRRRKNGIVDSNSWNFRRI